MKTENLLTKKEKISKMIDGHIINEAVHEDFTDIYYITDTKYCQAELLYKLMWLIPRHIKGVILFLYANDKGYKTLFEFWTKEVFANIYALTILDLLKRDNSYKNRSKFIEKYFEADEITTKEYFKRICKYASEFDATEYEWNNIRRNLIILPVTEIKYSERLYKRYIEVLDYYKDSFARMSEENIHEFVEAMREI